jgi:hypothetical protein
MEDANYLNEARRIVYQTFAIQAKPATEPQMAEAAG